MLPNLYIYDTKNLAKTFFIRTIAPNSKSDTYIKNLLLFALFSIYVSLFLLLPDNNLKLQWLNWVQCGAARIKLINTDSSQFSMGDSCFIVTFTILIKPPWKVCLKTTCTKFWVVYSTSRKESNFLLQTFNICLNDPY